MQQNIFFKHFLTYLPDHVAKRLNLSFQILATNMGTHKHAAKKMLQKFSSKKIMRVILTIFWMDFGSHFVFLHLITIQNSDMSCFVMINDVLKNCIIKVIKLMNQS